MKKIIAMLLAIVMILSLVACTQKTENDPSTDQPQASDSNSTSDDAAKPTDDASTGNADTLNIVLIPKLVHEFYNLILDGANLAVEELAEKGVTVNITWSAPTTADPVEQCEKLEAAIAQHPDVIGIAVIDGSMCKPLIEQAQAEGIKVISFDTDFEGNPADAFVGCSTDAQYESGAMAADALVAAIGKDEGTVAMLTGSPDAENHKLFSGGFRDRLASEYPGYTIVTEQADNDDKEKATELTEAILAQYPDIDGIFGGDGSAGVGAAAAVKSAVEAGQIEEGQVKITNYCLMADPEEAMRSGYLTVIIDYPPYWIGYYTVMAAAANVCRDVELQDVLLSFGVVDMENLDTYLDNYAAAREAEGLEYWAESFQ